MTNLNPLRGSTARFEGLLIALLRRADTQGRVSRRQCQLGGIEVVVLKTERLAAIGILIKPGRQFPDVAGVQPEFQFNFCCHRAIVVS